MWTYILEDICPHNIYLVRDISFVRCWADIVRTYISRDICPHYILLRFSPLVNTNLLVGRKSVSDETFFSSERMWIFCSNCQFYLVTKMAVTNLSFSCRAIQYIGQTVNGHIAHWHIWTEGQKISTEVASRLKMSNR